MDNTTAALVDYALRVKYSDLSPDVVDACKTRVLDSLGCIAAAYDHPVSVAARGLAHTYKTDSAATVLGSNRRVAPEMAAFANGVMLRLLDMSDMYRMKGGGHPSDVIPAALAAAEVANVSGEDLISAVAVAYEIYCGCCDVVDIQSQGWDQTVFAIVASAMAAGRLMGLDRSQMGHALSLALVPNMALIQTRNGELSSWKGCASANASRNALFAVLLARSGFTGPSAAIEGKGGLWDVVGQFDWSLQLKGAPFRINTTHLKCFPVCYHGQSAIWATLGLRDQVSIGQVEAIRIETYKTAIFFMASDPSRWAPATQETADHSLPYVAAVALRDGVVDCASFVETKLKDAQLLHLMQKTSVQEDIVLTADYPESSACRVTLITKDGKHITNEVKYPKGHDKSPLSKQEVDDKFVAAHAGFGSERRAHGVIELVRNLERLTDMAQLFSKFRHDETGSRARTVQSHKTT